MSIDTTKIIHGVVGGGRYTVTSPIVKEDYGLYLKIEGLELPSTYEVDFSNSEHNGTSVTMIGNADGVLIPSQFIASGEDVFAFLYHVGVDFGRTIYKFRIPNKLRPDRTNEQPTPEQQSLIDQAISALNSAVAQTAQDVIDADASAQSASQSADRAEEAKTDAQNYATQAEQSATDAQTSASQASASATASAQSAQNAETARQETTSLVAEAQRCADASAQSVQTAHTYASSANMASDMASDSADLASGYASSAQTSAQTASSKASEASTSASTASTKALESAQSASQALTYKTDAESAKTASQTAQGLAESARDSAISAKNDAEDARDEAQNLVDGISGKVEQIDSNTERIESLEDDRYKPYPTDTASGAVASFTDGADDIPLKSLIVNIDPVQDTSSGDPSPENICPISGWTGMQIQRTGKNLFDESTIYHGSYAISPPDYPLNAQNEAYRTVIIDNLPSGTYTFSTSLSNCVILRYLNGATNVGVSSSQTSITITMVKSGKFMLCFRKSDSSAITEDITVQVEQGSSATSYELYQGQTIPINWQTEAGTVYGGKLDVLSGVMRVDRGYIDLATLSGWVNNMLGQNAIEIRCTLTGKKEGRTNIISDMLKTGTETSTTDVAAYSVRGFLTSASIAVKAPKAVVTDSNGLVAWIGENHPTVCYELATPIEIQLDAHTINSLYGQNNIFADTGEAACEYRADTTLYISRLTEPDADMIADANITSGKYFMVGNNLYLATANIASGSAVIVGTNAIRKSLSEALNEINS